MNRDKLKASLTLHEGRKKFPYLDTEGNLTIGVGHNLDANGLPDQIIDALLEWDILQASSNLSRYLWAKELDEVRYRVVVEMMFGLGPQKFAGFKKMIQALADHDYERAAIEMLDSKWATQVGTRATRLAEMMRTGKDEGE
jgi:lysozyme